MTGFSFQHPLNLYLDPYYRLYAHGDRIQCFLSPFTMSEINDLRVGKAAERS